MYTSAIKLVKEHKLTFPTRKFTGYEDIVKAFQWMKDLSQEEFYVVALDQKHRMINSYMVSRGSLSATIVHNREIFKFAILQNAAAIIVVHNHPSGDTCPSSEDYDITNSIIKAGKILGIELLDHIIIGDRSISFRTHRLIDF